MTVFAKQPHQSVDYGFDWSGWLSGVSDKIIRTEWTADTGIKLGTKIDQGSTQSIYVSGGQAGVRYRVTCRVETNKGRKAERSFTIRVVGDIS